MGGEGRKAAEKDRLLNRKKHQTDDFLFLPKGTTCWVYGMKFPLVPKKWF